MSKENDGGRELWNQTYVCHSLFHPRPVPPILFEHFPPLRVVLIHIEAAMSAGPWQHCLLLLHGLQLRKLRANAVTFGTSTRQRSGSPFGVWNRSLPVAGMSTLSPVGFERGWKELCLVFFCSYFHLLVLQGDRFHY